MLTDSHKIMWYPLRVTYSRELKAKEFLDAEDIESFIPMRYVEDELVPAVHNLVFIHTDREELKRIKTSPSLSSFVRYIVHPITRLPLTIPDKQMHDFITIAGLPEDQVMYLSPSEVAMKKGEQVRIINGALEGVEGKFVRIKRTLRVVVNVEDIMAIATPALHPSSVTPIDTLKYESTFN